MKIIIKGVPRTKKNHQQVVMRGKKPIIIQGEAYRQYEELALWQLPHPREPMTEPCNVKCLYYMPNRRRVDLLNLLAATMDILVKGKVLEDDNSAIVVSHDGSRVRVDRENPRVEVEIVRAGKDTAEGTKTQQRAEKGGQRRGKENKDD